MYAAAMLGPKSKNRLRVQRPFHSQAVTGRKSPRGRLPALHFTLVASYHAAKHGGARGDCDLASA